MELKQTENVPKSGLRARYSDKFTFQ